MTRRKQTPTEKQISDMMATPTGNHFLDLGGYAKWGPNGEYLGSSHGYGRHWERNQSRFFELMPPTVLSFRWGLEVTHNIYHWLSERLEYAPDIDNLFHDIFVPEVDPDDEYYWPELKKMFGEWLREKGVSVGGIYGEGDSFGVNTYNGEDLLSQVLQYEYLECDGDFELDGEYYYVCGGLVLLQIHNGADVRGGYTAPHAFWADDNYGEYALLDNAQAYIICNSCKSDHRWFTDDGYHWYWDGYHRDDPGFDLKEVKVIEEDELEIDLRIRRHLADQYNFDQELVPIVSEEQLSPIKLPSEYAKVYGEALAGIVNAYQAFGIQAKAVYLEEDEKLPQFFIAETWNGGTCPICGEELHAYS